MIAVLKAGASPAQTASLIHWLEESGLEVHSYAGNHAPVVGMIGDLSRMDAEL